MTKQAEQIKIETLNEMTVKELRNTAKMLELKLGRLCVTKNLIKLAITHHLEELSVDFTKKVKTPKPGPLAQAEARKPNIKDFFELAHKFTILNWKY